MKLNFNVPLTNFDGEVKDENNQTIMLGKPFANMLGSNPHTNTGISYMDAMEWAISINKGEDVDLTTEQQNNLKSFIEKNEQLTAFAKKNLIDVFNK